MRIQSHLFHELHLELFRKDVLEKKKQRKVYENSMNLENYLTEEIGPVNIDEAPFRDHIWAVVQHPRPNCDAAVRRKMESAFDRVFGKPIASKI